MKDDKRQQLSVIYDCVLALVQGDLDNGKAPNKDLLNWLNTTGEYFLQKQTRTDLDQGEKPDIGY